MTLLDLYDFDDSTDRILVTCALPYVNNLPHLGNMVPIVSADVYSRYLRLEGIRSIYICATDEHGTRTEIEAAKAGLDEDTYCRQLHDRMLKSFDWFNVEFTHFGRTSSPENHAITQEMFLSADKNGYVVEQESRQLHCATCEQYLPDTYVEGTCPYCNTPGAKGDQCDTCSRFLDPFELIGPRCKICGQTPETRETRHLFLRLDALSAKLEAWIKSKDHWSGIIRNMPLGWITEGLRPRAITRDLRWGVPVPKAGYENKVFYVWFDAPIGYVAATAEWAKTSGESLNDWWKGGRARLVHFLGKDNVPFHTLMWPGTILAADDGWNTPDFIAANEYLTYEGGAFSKSRGRGVFSEDVMAMGFHPDAIRFFLIANRPEKRDTDFSFEALKNVINASLVGNFGNLANRTLSFIQKRFGEIPEPGPIDDLTQGALDAAKSKIAKIDEAYATFELRAAARYILELSDIGNGYFQAAEPWKTFKTDLQACKTTLYTAAWFLQQLARWAWPIMPDRCELILEMMGLTLADQLEPGRPVSKPRHLFTPIEDERIEELIKQYEGAGRETLGPLEFEKRPEITWPCVILELSEMTIRRRTNKLECWKEESLQGIDLDALASGERLREYTEILEERDVGGRTVSVQNLIEIVRREGKLPNINTLVDIYNTYSLTRSVVMGAYERRTIHGKLIYAAADGSEQFIPVKSRGPEKISPGEWILKDETNMVVTKVTTKQSEAAAISTQTTDCVMCIQGNGTTDIAELTALATEMAAQIVAFCGGSYRIVHAG
jgi:methionyl-tRNA synthetase